MKSPVSAAVLALLAVVSPVSAQPAPAAFNPLVNVSNTAGQRSDTAAIIVDAATTYVAWREESAAAQEIRIRRSTNGVVSFIDGTNGRLVAAVDPAETVYAVRVAAAGAMVYVLYTSGVEPRLAKARLARSEDGGATFAAPVTLAGAPDAGGTAFADLAVDGTGVVHVVIESRDAEDDIKHLSSIDLGLTFSAAVPLNSSPAPSTRPRLAANGSRIAVVWEDLLAAPGDSKAGDIAFVYSNDSGASFGTMVNLSASDADSTRPAVAIGNHVHVVWTEGDAVVVRSSGDGAAFGATQQLAAAPAGAHVTGVAVGSGLNTVHVSWITTDADGLMHGPFYRRSTDSAATFAAVQDLRLGTAGNPFGGPAIANGTIARIVWPHSPSGFEPDADVHAAAEPNCRSVWKAAVSGNWNDASKWSPAVIPGVGSIVCITADGAPYTVTVPAGQNAGELTIGHAESEHRPTVRITGSLTIGASLVNSGDLTFGNGGGLVSAAGTIINSERGRLMTAAGAAASINGSATNYGEVDLAAKLSILGNLRTITNLGSFRIQPGASTAFGGNFVFNQNDGVLNVEGAMEFSAEFNSGGDIFNFNGGRVDGVVIISGHSRLTIGGGSMGKGTFQFERNVIFGISSGGHFAGHIAPLQTVRLMGTAGFNNNSAQVHMAEGATNAGTIEMTASAATSGNAVLVINGTLVSTGRIVAARPGDGNVGRIDGVLENRGTMDVEDDLTFGTNGRLTNVGTINVAVGASMAFGANYVINHNGGVLKNAGKVEMSAEFSTAGDTFNFNDGTIEGEVIIQGHSRLNIGPGSVGAGTFVFERNVAFGFSSGGHLSGDIAAAQTVRLRGTVGGTSQANVAAGFTNFGSLILESTAANAGGATLVLAAGTLVNRGTLLVSDMLPGKALRGHLENRATMTVLRPLSLQLGNGTFNNFSDLTVGPNGKITLAPAAVVTQNAGTMTLDGPIELATEFSTAPDLFNFAGGNIIGAAGVHLTSTSRLNIAATAAEGAAKFVYRIPGNTGGGTIAGAIGKNMTVRLQGNSVTAANGLANAGTIVLTTEGANVSPALNVTAGALANTGTIIVEPTNTGAPINAVVLNHGHITIKDTISLTRANASHVNDSELEILASNTLTVTGNSTFRNAAPGTIGGSGTLTIANGSILAAVGSFIVNVNNSGRFRPGDTLGVVDITGNYTQTATGRVEIEIAGFGAGAAFDKVHVSGVATLAGTLDAQIAPGSCVEGSYPFMTYASVVGDFATKLGLNPGGGRTLAASRGANVYALNVTGPPCNLAPVANADAYSTNQGVALTVAAPGVLANDTDAQNDALSAVLAIGPSHGTLLLNANGSFVYKPNAAFAGTDTFTYRVSDGSAQSGETTVTITVVGEKVPPVTTATLSEAANANGWHRAAVTVMLNSDDGPNGSGVQYISVAVDGAPAQIVDGATAAVLLADEGVHTIRYFAVDRAGNTEIEKQLTVRIDLTPPTASVNRTAANEHGWNNGDVTVTFNAEDGLSGITGEATVEVIRADEGAHQNAAATFTDLADNSATFIVEAIHIDKTSPVVTGTRQTPPNQHGWNNGPVMVSFTASDDLSGVAGDATANVTVDSEGADQSASARFTDRAGNSADGMVTGINIDLTPPTASTTRTPPNVHGWNNGDVVVSFVAEDALSGIDGAATADVIKSAEGADQSATATFADLAGNRATFVVDAIHIDKTPPVVSGVRQTAPNRLGWNNGPVIVSFTATDALSGIAGEPTAEVTLAGEGANQSASAEFTDRAGNSASATVSSINIDVTAPTIVGAPDRAPNANGWYNRDVTISFRCADALSGIDTCAPASIVISEEGDNLSRASVATDRAGNTAQAAVGGIKLDKTAPIVACSNSAPTLWPPNHKLVAVEATVTVTDAGSGPEGFTLERATSSEADNGLGDGDTANDVQGFTLGTPDTSGLLRAERSGRGTARTYSLHYLGADLAGNTAACTTTSTVTHDQGGGKK